MTGSLEICVSKTFADRQGSRLGLDYSERLAQNAAALSTRREPRTTEAQALQRPMIDSSCLPCMLCLRDIRVTGALRTISRIIRTIRISSRPHDNVGFVGLAYPPRN